MADERKGLLEHFATVAGVEEERARFFLEMTNWNLDLALTNFFESNEDSDTEVVAHPRDPTPPRGTDHSARHGVPAVSGSAAQGGKGAARPTAPSSKIASLSTLRKDEKSDESSEEEEGQAYYAGGSERTGQQILGPPKKKTNPDKLISGLFTAAKEHGAEEMEPEGGGGGAASAGGPRVVPFQGRAYRLGDPSTQSEVIEGPQVQQKRKVDVAMKFWRNGFSLNDGPLREFDTPQNVEFVNAIRRNEVPRELIEQARGGEVNLSLEDHRNEDYVAPKKVVQSFTGVGRRLGSPTDAGINMDTGAASSSSAAAAAAYTACATSTAATGAASSSSSSAASAAEADAARSIHLDASQPLTNLQIRLSDGSRLVAKFNHSHTVSDVRRYIVSARPQFANTNFVLMTTFPNRELSDEKQTLAAANLLNAVLVQKSSK